MICSLFIILLTFYHYLKYNTFIKTIPTIYIFCFYMPSYVFPLRKEKHMYHNVY